MTKHENATVADFLNSVLVVDACHLLGKSRPTINAMIARGELTAFTYERKMRILKDGKFTQELRAASRAKRMVKP